MRDWDAARIARAAGARLLAEAAGARARVGPLAATVDSRTLAPGELFVGLRGDRADGGSFAAQALREGAWGVIVTPEHADPLAGMQALARAWRRELAASGAKVVAITGSTGKTSTKDILAALFGGGARTAASPANLNTEIGLPLAILSAPPDTERVVLEMAMRGPGQIAELTAIAEPDVGVIVNVGPAHLELLGSLEAVAAAKAELIAGLAAGASVVVPAGEPLLAPHLRADLNTITFGEDAEVSLVQRLPDGRVRIRAGSALIELWPSFDQAHHINNLLAAVAAARALGHAPEGRLQVSFSARRGERLALATGVVVIDDCYNANPMSMRAAIDDLAATASERRVAVLGDMLELGVLGPALHREIGAHASEQGVDVLVAVGPLAREIAASFAGEAHSMGDATAAAALLPALLRAGDTVLVKGSRGVGLERVVAALAQAHGPGSTDVDGPRVLAPGAVPGRR